MGTRTHPACPVCAKAAPPREGEPRNPSFPFCSPACKLVDLGRWLDGGYRIPGPPLESSLEGIDLDRDGSGRDEE
jgi:endogenous inhibitor of DNA gyrase (YacG/DUF329 family)